MSEQRQRVAIVTGGSRGIGRRVAERLAASGTAVVVTYQTAAASAEEVVERIRAQGGRASAVGADVADPASVAHLFAAAEEIFGGVDIVVHAAGVLTKKPLVELSVEEIDAMLHTNLRGTLLVSQRAAVHLRNGGSIINFSTAVTKVLAPGYTAYVATKAGLEAAGKVLARELAGRNITVNVVAPGPTESDMLASDLDSSPDPAAARRWMEDATPLGRLGTPDDIADVVLALTGSMPWVNGQVIHSSGGFV
ncbi:SDR family oxidoreductase [Streptomyces sp. NPDC049916]|uniref:SDR family oxidoreductase n=1 Tax=Streptomyces sp. NPDC049916 TaxID=3155156 RepID=UPI003420C82C